MTKETLQQKIKRALGRFTPGRIAIIMLGTAILSFGIHNIHQRTAITEGGIIGLVLLLSFTIGLGLSNIAGTTLRDSFTDFKEIIIKLIEVVIIPLLPLHIFGIFLNMTVSGQVMSIITMFLKVIIVIFALHVLLLLIQFTIAGAIAGKNPLRLLKNMLPAYATALGTQSRDTGAGCQEWRTREYSDLYRSALRHDPSGR